MGEEKSAFNLIMAGGDIPDIMRNVNDHYSGGVVQAVEDGIFIDLTDYAEQFAPDYVALINQQDDWHKEIYTEDECLLAFYQVWPDGNSTANRVIVNQQWWAEYSDQDYPVTLDDYDAFFAHIKQTYPNVIPFCYEMTSIKWMGAFNLLDGWIVRDGEVVNSYATQEYWDYLELMNKWYEAGYINPDFATMENTEIRKLFSTGQTATIVATVDLARSDAENSEMKPLMCPNPRQSVDSVLHTSEKQNFCGGNAACVYSECKYIEEAIMFLNYGYTEDGFYVYNYGVEGMTYNMVDGEPVYTDLVLNNPDIPLNAAIFYWRIHVAPKWCANGVKTNPAILGDPEGLRLRLQFTDDANLQTDYRLSPAVMLTTEENARRAEIMTDVNTYIEEMRIKFITGAEPLSNYDAYLTQLDAYDYQEAESITQAAYDRYASR